MSSESMATAIPNKDRGAQGTKRKREMAPVLVASQASHDEVSASDTAGSQDDQGPLLDSFDSDLAQALQAFDGAVTNTTAFLQPSEQLSSLARSAAKVSCDPATAAVILYGCQLLAVDL